MHEEAAQGRFESNWERDVLTHALENKEHPGRTREAGVVAWRIAFKDDWATYRSRLWRDAE